jgi:hypothetical protein
MRLADMEAFLYLQGLRIVMNHSLYIDVINNCTTGANSALKSLRMTTNKMDSPAVRKEELLMLMFISRISKYMYMLVVYNA